MDGLIIKPYWLNKILSHEKTVEVRGSDTKKTGEKIYLIESKGKVRGTAIIRNTVRFTEDIWQAYKDVTGVTLTWEELTKRYNTPTVYLAIGYGIHIAIPLKFYFTT